MKWTKVTDDLPELDQDVLVILPMGGGSYFVPFVARYEGLGRFRGEDDNELNYVDYSPRISHWMALPPAPTDIIDPVYPLIPVMGRIEPNLINGKDTISDEEEGDPDPNDLAGWMEKAAEMPVDEPVKSTITKEHIFGMLQDWGRSIAKDLEAAIRMGEPNVKDHYLRFMNVGFADAEIFD